MNYKIYMAQDNLASWCCQMAKKKVMVWLHHKGCIYGDPPLRARCSESLALFYSWAVREALLHFNETQWGNHFSHQLRVLIQVLRTSMFYSFIVQLQFVHNSLRSPFSRWGVSAVKASVKLESFIAGRWTLGRVCHTLQVRTMIIVPEFVCRYWGDRRDQNNKQRWCGKQCLILCIWRTSTAIVTGWSWGTKLLTALWSDQTNLSRTWQVGCCCLTSTRLLLSHAGCTCLSEKSH